MIKIVRNIGRIKYYGDFFKIIKLVILKKYLIILYNA